MARVRQIALDVDGRVAEELLALARGAVERPLELVLRQRDAEALAAPAAGGLDRHGIADRVVDDLSGRLGRLDRVGRSRDDRDARVLHQLARTGFRAHRVDRLGRRADEDDPGLVAGAGEAGVLGEEAVAGVARLGAGLLCDLDQLVDHEVALIRGPGADQECLVRTLHVQRLAVRLGVDGHRADAHLLERPHDTDGDLAPVCDQYLREQGERESRAWVAARMGR